MHSSFNLMSLRKRILGVILLISFLFCSLFVRLFVVQIIDGKELQIRATDQWTRDLPITAERGRIYDASGSTLAVSYTTYNIYSRGREITDAVSVSSYLSQKLGVDFQKIFGKVSEKGVSEVLLKVQVDELTAKEIHSKNFKGIYIAENIDRYYPYGDLLTQVLGFTTIDNVGQSGVEAYYNKYLKGQDGYTFVQSDLRGKEIENALATYVPAIPGLNVKLTVDSQIQLVVEQALNNVMREQLAKSATAIVMNPKTGEIVALSSKPSFDLNNVPRDDVFWLFDSVKNKAVVDVYEPGSTFKILTVASALDSQKTSLDDHFYCGGSHIVDGQKIKCWKFLGHESQDLAEGFQNSCNVVFMNLAMRMGTDNFYSYLKNFGLGSKTGITISGESAGILMSEKSVKTVDLARIGFGHAVAVTPLQLLTASAAAVNGGKLMQPYIVSEISDKNGKVVERSVAKAVKQVVSTETSKTVNYLMEMALSKTGKNTFVPGYAIGGKTGTAQKYSENGAIAQGKYISSFIGTYPADNPEYIMLLLVDEPGAGAYYGSVVASPYAKQIFEGIFSIKNIKPSGDVKVLKEVEMPELRGKSLTDAIVSLTMIGLQYEIDGEGGVVIGQLPPAGTKVIEGTTVVLIM